ncbi:MAG: DEAD/DEAH box helicase [archaeon]|nr:DEAD/DEAH box helicase [archaeon]
MNVDELNISDDVKQALRSQGYTKLYPPQEVAIPKALSGKNLVVEAPTASGKSLIGLTAAIKTILERKKKVLYIVPLKALASEKKDDMDKLSLLGIKTAVSTGDLDSDEKQLNDSNFIVATSEKTDSLLRHGSKLIDDVGLVIADEIHLIHDVDRGPTLEIVLTKIKRKLNECQIIALSATISNADELSAWLNADLVKINWRPIPLYEGIYYNQQIRFANGRVINVLENGDSVWSLMEQTFQNGGQCIVFVNARRSTESLATKYSSKMKKFVERDLADNEISEIEGDVTSLGVKLVKCIKHGIAFHNAGLTFGQRRYVEKNFRNGNIKCIVTTPTLAAGINLPARRVIIRDTKRFEANSGSIPIPVMEIKQMCGRAGRPHFDSYGEAILVAKNYSDYRNLMDNYIMCESESVISKLGSETVLRNHILGLIATGDASSVRDIINFLKDTFYGNEFELYGVEDSIEKIISFLIEEGMVTSHGAEIKILPFGKRVSELYIDPKSAVILRESILTMEPNTPDFPILLAVAMTPDIIGLYPRKKDIEELILLEQKWKGKFIVKTPDSTSFQYEYFLSDLKVAHLIYKWIHEVSEDDITEDFGIGPGDIRSRVDMVDWLLYGMAEIGIVYKYSVVKTVRNLLTRVKYGIKDDILDLVLLKGVGRIRARTLANNNIKNREDILKISEEKLSSIPGIGKILAQNIKRQVGGFESKI